jgi:hypothetical protein
MLTVLLSVVLGIIPALGIVWTIFSGMIATVDGLFLTLILLALSGIFFANAALELRRGIRDEEPAKAKAAGKAS